MPSAKADLEKSVALARAPYGYIVILEDMLDGRAFIYDRR